VQKTFYHTQECRDKELKNPIKCLRDDAWLGEAFYYWFEIEDAEYWGYVSKKTTEYFEIYESTIEFDNILDTVFNEEHYFFWYKQLEKAAKEIISKTKIKPTIKEINDYFIEKALWNVDGIQFQDLPSNPNQLLIKPIEYKKKIIVFPYRKRIQIAIYNQEVIKTFSLFKKEKCK
jgi:hypothetical protein